MALSYFPFDLNKQTLGNGLLLYKESDVYSFRNPDLWLKFNDLQNRSRKVVCRIFFKEVRAQHESSQIDFSPKGKQRSVAPGDAGTWGLEFEQYKSSPAAYALS